MTELLTYLLKTAIVQCVLLFCYRLLLRRDTFHKMIRYYFMAGLIFSYIAPLIHFDFRILPPVQNNILQLSRVAQPAIVLEITEEPKMLFIPEILEISGMLPNVEPLPKTTTKWWQQYSFVDILTTVFIAGVIVMLIRFVIQFLSLASLRVCRKYKYQQYNILDIEAPIKPFSFGKRIYINPKLHDVGEFDEIIRHELVHVRQRHSVDIIVAAVNRSVFWWNPFAWVLNSDIRNNLEYIVDNEMLQSGINRKHYQYHLLHINQLTYINDMANYFNFSNFKKRIEMMDKEKTHPVYKMKWLLLPLVATVILLSFNAKRAIATNFAFAGKSEIVEPKPAIVADTTEFRYDATRQEPLILIDGKESETNILANLQSDDIHSFSIYKHDSVTKVYGAKSKAGVISVITKQKNEDEIVLKSKEMLDSVDIAGFVDDFSKLFITRGSSDSSGVCLIIIDGKKSDRNRLSKLKREKIQSISVLKDKSAKKRYGDEGKNGVVIIETKDNENVSEIKNVQDDIKTMLYQEFDSMQHALVRQWRTILDSVNANSEPLVIIDNGESNVKEIVNLKHEDIHSFSILKANVAKGVYGDKGKNGVVIVETKQNHIILETKKILHTMDWMSKTDVKFTPLVIIDDKESSVEKLTKLNRVNIISFYVLKDESAAKMYGDKGKEGVILVKTK